MGLDEIRNLGESIRRLTQACDLTKQCVPVSPHDLSSVLANGRERSALASKGLTLACAVEAYFAGECDRKRLEEMALDLLRR